MTKKSLLSDYVRQQRELGMPDVVFSRPFNPAAAAAGRAAALTQPKGADRGGASSRNAYERLAKIAPFKAVSAAPAPAAPTPASGKRAVLKELFMARCERCGLAKSRRSFVFGAGNVDAPVMIIGEAPGAEEDARGLPFVGPAGRLLDEVLTAMGWDRKRDFFITNILKCRPPDNRSPGSAEVAACLPLLEKQIEVIAPRALLLLGRISAHALLQAQESIAKLRCRTHEYRGIPVVVTYHPAAVLRSPEYRRPLEDDLGRLSRLLKEGTVHGNSG